MRASVIQHKTASQERTGRGGVQGHEGRVGEGGIGGLRGSGVGRGREEVHSLLLSSVGASYFCIIHIQSTVMLCILCKSLQWFLHQNCSKSLPSLLIWSWIQSQTAVKRCTARSAHTHTHTYTHIHILYSVHTRHAVHCMEHTVNTRSAFCL